MSNNLNRRDLLTRAPAALAVIASPAVASAVPATAENPKLLALGAKLPEIEQAYQDALKAWSAAWNLWSPQWPLAPEACCSKWGAEVGGREMERDIRGVGLIREGARAPWMIKTAAEMEQDIERARESLARDDRRKRSAGKRFRRYRHEEIASGELGLALLPGYLAERERIRRESGFEAIDKARNRTADALFAFAREVLAEQSSTIEGVRIKAQACAALGRMHSYDARWAQLGDTAKHKASMAGLLGKALLEVI